MSLNVLRMCLLLVISSTLCLYSSVLWSMALTTDDGGTKTLEPTFPEANFIVKNRTGRSYYYNTELEEKFENRRETVRKMCLKHFGINVDNGILQTPKLSFMDYTFFDDNYKLLFCTIPKVASTNIKQLLANLIPDQQNNREIRRLIDLASIEEQMKRIKSYTKVVFVRHPVERLISAWRDKFYSGKFENPELEAIVERIIKKIRSNTHEPSRQKHVSLEEFFKFLLAEGTRLLPYDNPHWRPFVDHCDPCRINYDYIGVFENLPEELSYIVNITTDGRNVALPRPAKDSYAATRTGNFTLLQRFGHQVKQQLMKDIFERYEADFDLFGYDAYNYKHLLHKNMM